MNEAYNTNDDMEPHQASHESCEASLTPFPAANNDYRYLRQRATILCAAFNAQPLEVSDKERAQAWNEYVFVQTPKDQYIMLINR
jgi:hypothetical protein